LLLVGLPSSLTGMGLPQMSSVPSRILESLGIALFLSGTVSVGIELYFRKKTAGAVQALLETITADQNSELYAFLNSFIQDLKVQNESIHEQASSAHVRMFYSERKNAMHDMARAIQGAQEFVYVMGVSCKEFFFEETECHTALYDAFVNRELDIKVLILDWQCDEAFERSKREESPVFEIKGVDDSAYRQSSMFFDTMKSRNAIIGEYLPQTTPRDGRPSARSRIACKLYKDISLFLVITDKVAFMEPYHFGERRENVQGLRKMAELVPLIEFEKTAKVGPHDQFKGHFEYVFNNRSTPMPVDGETPKRAEAQHGAAQDGESAGAPSPPVS